MLMIGDKIMNNPRVYFDLETGGLEPHHPIIQLAAVAMYKDRQQGQFEVKLTFSHKDCEPEALALNNYSEEAWKGAVAPDWAARMFAAFLEPYKTVEKISKAGKNYKVAQLIGYNAHQFDGPRLIKLFNDNNIFFPANYRVLDTLQLAMWYFEVNPGRLPKDFKLSSVCEYFGITLDNAHDALADVIATARLTEKLLCRE
jgi:DNA polymerase III subunit epsilon